MKPLTNAVGLRVHDLCLGVLNVVSSGLTTLDSLSRKISESH